MLLFCPFDVYRAASSASKRLYLLFLMAERIRSVLESKFVKAGLPLLGLVVGGWMGISFLVGERIRVRDAQRHVDEDTLPPARYKAAQFSIEGELQRLHQHINLHSYENKPVPRPENWEEYVLPGQEDEQQ